MLNTKSTNKNTDLTKTTTNNSNDDLSKTHNSYTHLSIGNALYNITYPIYIYIYIYMYI